MRIGVFGGTFDPVHRGHLEVAAVAHAALRLDRVHFVPTAIQPFKRTHTGAPAADRLAMVRLAVEGHAYFLADSREVERGGVSYTIDTLRDLKADCPEDELFLLVGADAARELPKWRDALALPTLATIVSLQRDGTSAPAHPLITVNLAVPAIAVSSTDIRDAVRDRLALEAYVTPAVARYIAVHRLYR